MKKKPLKVTPCVALLVALAASVPVVGAETEFAVVDLDTLPSLWTLVGRPKGPTYPREIFKKGMETCLAIGFVIDSNGQATNISILRTITNKPGETDALAQIKSVALQAVTQWRYEPASGNASRKPVYTYTTLSESFSLTSVTGTVADKHAHEIENACRIADFPAAVARGDFVQKEGSR